MSGSYDQLGQHRYGAVHKAARKGWARLVAAGGVVCWRCGGPIPPAARWDLGHVDEEGRRRGYPLRHPEHIRCNRATLPRMLAEARGEAPRRGKRPPKASTDRFGGLPDPTPDNGVEVWSCHWDVGRFNPRCPDCRERGSMCDVALERARKAAA